MTMYSIHTWGLVFLMIIIGIMHPPLSFLIPVFVFVFLCVWSLDSFRLAVGLFATLYMKEIAKNSTIDDASKKYLEMQQAFLNEEEYKSFYTILLNLVSGFAIIILASLGNLWSFIPVCIMFMLAITLEILLIKKLDQFVETIKNGD